MWEPLEFFGRNKCTIWKAIVAVGLSALLVGIFAAGGGALLPGLFAKFAGAAKATALMIFLARIVMIAVGTGIAMSRLGDWIICELFGVKDCCQKGSVPFWRLFGEIYEALPEDSYISPEDCARLRAEIDRADIEETRKAALRRFVAQYCEDE
ncbi:hypothetical protein [Tepidicaulis sp.]|jgi:hypothetical protein|uniref:hypothetical protein n=1 Tax=Tepidicaulis sp. TaxID=1920809 RepID=UPI003B5CB57F